MLTTTKFLTFFSKIAIIFLIVFTDLSYATNLVITENGTSIIKIKRNTEEVSFKLSIDINGYEINCQKNKMIIWGIPKKFNPSSAQDNALTIIDLDLLKINFTLRFGRGIFGVKYIENGDLAFIETDNGHLLNVMDGTVKQTDPNTETEENFIFETCPSFKYKSFNRFTEIHH